MKDLDSLHQDLLRLLDEIDTQDNPGLAIERFSIIEKHGYRVSFLTGSKGAGLAAERLT